MSGPFTRLYDRTLGWAGHRHAPWYLAGLSFAESSFFPIPPDVMLAPMVLSRPERAWRLAALTTIASVLGGVAGYLIGALALELVLPWIVEFGYQDAYTTARDWFDQWGFWVVLIAGFSPIPYKVFTVAAGAMLLPLAPFILASAIGRGSRFFLVAGLVAWGGPRFAPLLRRHVERLGWATVLVLVIAIGVWQFQ